MNNQNEEDKYTADIGKEVDISELLAKRSAELALEKKCEEIKILDLRGLTSVTDYFVIATADSERKAKA
ncbi:MAG: RsfS/YbeB/iojap family protein, partial [Chlorobium sp.]